MKQKCVMIIAGEASGDLHGSMLVKAMLEKNNTLFFVGVGGKALKEAGVKIFFDASEISVVGITEVFSRMPGILKAMFLVKKHLKNLRPDLLILIDFPDFNLRIASAAKKLGITVLYYISPQVWAWRPGRIKKMKGLIDHMAVILPFEKEYYKNHRIPVTFVGHPLLDTDVPVPNISYSGKKDDKFCIGLLPGSRDKEIMRHLPVMLETASILTKRLKNIKFIISLAPSVNRQPAEMLIEKYNPEIYFDVVSDIVGKVFERCTLVIAASGTVTLEAALSCKPMVIIYKVSPLTYLLGKALISVSHVSLVNLIMGKEIVPELLQTDAVPENISDIACELLNDSDSYNRIQKKLYSIRDVLGGPGASERTAQIALSLLS